MNDVAVKEAVQRASVDMGRPLHYLSAVSRMPGTPSAE